MSFATIGIDDEKVVCIASAGQGLFSGLWKQYQPTRGDNTHSVTTVTVDVIRL